MSDDEADIDDLYDRALETLEKIASKEDEEDLDPVLSYLDDLEDIIDEAEDLISHVDLADLAEAIDWEEIPDAFDLDDLAATIDDDEDAVTIGKFLEIIDLTKLWGSMDAREAWREKREFEDELDDVTDGDADVEEAESGDTSMPRMDFDDFDPESAENAIQAHISGSVDEFREALIRAHVRLKEFRENNKDRFKDRRRKRSRNPTAYSTLPPGRDALGKGTRFSTVPRETKYSSAPNRKRIYGNRFEKAAEELED